MVRARLASGEVVRAHLANTARLGDILVPGAEVVLQPATAPHRRTRWSVTRVWDGTWVALEANTAADLVVDHLCAAGAIDGWPPVTGVRREVTRDGHRFDVEVDRADGGVGVVEVKSLSRAVDGVAPLSWTPSGSPRSARRGRQGSARWPGPARSPRTRSAWPTASRSVTGEALQGWSVPTASGHRGGGQRARRGSSTGQSDGDRPRGDHAWCHG